MLANLTQTLKLSTLSTLIGLSVFCVTAQAQQRLLPPNPKIISLLVSGPGENFSSQFGHINLRISYGNNLNNEADMTVGFGPQLEVSNPLQYFRVGKDLKMIHWIQSIHDQIEQDSKEKMIVLTSLQLELSDDERNSIVSAINNAIMNKEMTYHAFFENCSSLVAKVLHEYGSLPRGALSFLPAQLEKKVTPHAVSRMVFPTGIEIKSDVLKRHASTLNKTIPDLNERAVFLKQLNSRHTEFRLLAYRRLAARKGTEKLMTALMQTESDRRQYLLTTALKTKDQNSVELMIPIAQNEKLDSMETDGHRIRMKLKLPNFANASGKNSHPETRSKNWKASEIGLNESNVSSWKSNAVSIQNGRDKKVIFWVTPNLWQDPD